MVAVIPIKRINWFERVFVNAEIDPSCDRTGFVCSPMRSDSSTHVNVCIIFWVARLTRIGGPAHVKTANKSCVYCGKIRARTLHRLQRRANLDI